MLNIKPKYLVNDKGRKTQGYSVLGFSSNFGHPRPVGAVWNRTGLEEEDSKM